MAGDSASVSEVMGAKCLYQVLGIGREASEDEVKKAYKKRALKLHPDKNDHPNAEEAFKKVAEAVAVLSDEEKRRFYDKTGRVPGEQNGGGGAKVFTGHEIDPDDIFRMFFGSGTRGMGGQGVRMHFGGGAPFGGHMGGPFGGFQHGGIPRRRQHQPTARQEQSGPVEEPNLFDILKTVLFFVAIWLWFTNPTLFFVAIFIWNIYQRASG